MSLLQALAKITDTQTAVVFENKHYTYAQLIEDTKNLAKWLEMKSLKSVCINLANSYDWVLIDLACQEANIICTPIPQFFSPQQVEHLVEQTKPDVVLGHAINPGESYEIVPELLIKAFFKNTESKALVPLNTSKITFTSGSTGQAKGVCLSAANQIIVAQSLVSAIGIKEPKHLVLLPFATLLENIAGIYAPLLAGGQVLIPGDKNKGFSGSRLNDLSQLLSCISSHSPHTMILVPELLQALITGCKNGWVAPTSLAFIAVGGAKVDAKLIQQARQYGLPVFQGYGLSECASVVSICADKLQPADSAGKVLEHVQVSQVNGELVVSGNCFLGYLDQPNSWYPKSVNTGDIVSMKDNFLFIEGRSKHLIINSFGRNISPEWIESKLAATGLFVQSLVLGDAKPYLCALLVPLSANISHELIDAAINKLNQDLPDYARVLSYFVLPEAFSVLNGLATENGKLKRSAIECYYAKQINQQYVQQSPIAV